MKELSQHIKEETKIVAQQEQKKQIKFLGTLAPKKGQSVYELNMKTYKISLAQYSEIEVDIKRGLVKKLITKEGCMYVVALNEKNADRKFRPMISKLVAKIKADYLQEK